MTATFTYVLEQNFKSFFCYFLEFSQIKKLVKVDVTFFFGNSFVLNNEIQGKSLSIS